MKLAPEISQAIRTQHDIKALPRLIADWNMNRYFDTTVDNTPSEDTDGNDDEVFPIESIVGPFRPTKGINKARIGQATVSDGYRDNHSPRFYISSAGDKYKYWESPYVSDAAGNITGVQPHVIYSAAVQVNKVVIKLENSWASPTDFKVEYTTVATPNTTTDWTVMSTTPTIRNDGSIVLFYDGSTWSSNNAPASTSLMTIRGLRLTVNKLGPGKDGLGNTTTYRVRNSSGVYETRATTGGNSYFSLIEMAAHRVVDLSDKLIQTSTTLDAGEVDAINPMGTITSNVGNVTLWNGDNEFSTDNPDSPYAGLLDANVNMTLSYIYHLDAGTFSVQEFTMYTGPWTGQKDATVSVELDDFSKYLKEVKPPPVMWENLTLAEIMYRLCDSVGFNNYRVVQGTEGVDYKIPVFYADGEATIWEVLNELAQATQSVIYFDSYGVMNVRTRENMYDLTKSPAWTLRGATSGAELADIVELTQNEAFGSNVVKVSYQTQAWTEWNNGMPAMQTVWEPEGTMVLRASPLISTMAIDGTLLRIPPNDAKIWQYSGIVQVQGELMRYEGKRFVYYTYTKNETINPDGSVVLTYTNEQRNVVKVKSQDEFKKYNEMTPFDYRAKNHWTGELFITERGLWNSEARAHSVDATGYSVRRIVNGTRAVDVGGFRHNKQASTVTMKSGPRFDSPGDRLLATKGATDDTGFIQYGFKFKFENVEGLRHQRAGIVIHNNGADENGYYIEFCPSSKFSGATRKNRNELIFYSRKGGEQKIIGGKGNTGVPLAIAAGVEYECDIYVSIKANGDHHIDTWVNGKKFLTSVVAEGSGWQNAKNGRFGLCIRGVTQATYEYLYAIARDEEVMPADDVSFLERVRGGFIGGMWDREWVYGWRTYTRRHKKRSTKHTRRFNRYFFDEFGPIVHEVREMDVKLDPTPILHSRLYMTNDWSVICTEYRADPFSAHFVVANTSRQNAVIHGPETLSYAGSDKEVDHKFIIIGRPLVIGESEEIVVRDEGAIRARGEIESELTNKWIQTKEYAQALADWIKNHWASGIDDVSVVVFGNPLIEVGDSLVIDFPEKDMTTTEARYFVVGVNNQFENGLTTNLTLRRIPV